MDFLEERQSPVKIIDKEFSLVEGGSQSVFLPKSLKKADCCRKGVVFKKQLIVFDTKNPIS